MTLLITGDVNLVHLAKVVFTRFLQSGVIFSVFLMWTIYKVFIDLLQYQFCFTFWFFGQEACGILAPPPGIEPITPALETKP